MGKYIRVVSERAAVVASDKMWLEDAALQQLAITSQLPGMRRAVGLPDLHPGRGYPVGAAFFSVGRFYPALCGGDIGCGIGLWQTDLAIGKVSLDKLDKQIGNLDAPPAADELERLQALAPWLGAELAALEARLRQAALDPACMRSLATIGPGSHFVALQAVVQVDEPALVEGAGLVGSALQLVVRSGSRGLGSAVLRAHIETHGHAGLAEGTPAAQTYLLQHDAALAFARLNRKMIVLRMRQRLCCEALPVLDVPHKQMTPDVIEGEQGWLHRKGANPADAGPVLLPGSRDGHSYLIRPLPVADSVSLQSLAHGGLALACMEGAGLVRVMARSRPVLTYKARGECS